ncbi:MAG: hypothetical protein HND44_20235 [Chloroflexi bacterium]|nr:hypothetical protein [Ardenticatenaceae bacterium]MBL1130779.1 hypothetical protein [Chloroflexota bacterium]NOG36874.1 hypothetical protein [Chloroflexota bacterium]
MWSTAVLTFLWGLALFLTDAGLSTLVWVWPGDLFTSRLIAVMLWTLAAAAVYSLHSTDALRVALVVMITYGIGVVAANFWNPAALKSLYTLVFTLFAVSSLIILLRKGE